VLASSFAEIGTNWNIQIHYWLKYYVMLRLMDRSQPKGAAQLKATVLTFVISSFWHGTYPGYILFFVAASMLEI
jgi:lysophospholipid acyltransferase